MPPHEHDPVVVAELRRFVDNQEITAATAEALLPEFDALRGRPPAEVAVGMAERLGRHVPGWRNLEYLEPPGPSPLTRIARRYADVLGTGKAADALAVELAPAVGHLSELSQVEAVARRVFHVDARVFTAAAKANP